MVRRGHVTWLSSFAVLVILDVVLLWWVWHVFCFCIVRSWGGGLSDGVLIYERLLVDCFGCLVLYIGFECFLVRITFGVGLDFMRVFMLVDFGLFGLCECWVFILVLICVCGLR